jgi:ferrochelatase
MKKTAVVLMNLGGPDSPEAVEPFLRNLFGDPAIIALPGPLRRPLAKFVAARRAPVAREIYAWLGGGSPLLANTEAQARALEAALGPGHRSFIAMRYWHPTTEETARAVREWAPDEIVCLPLYPQFSTTTTASSLAAWRRATARERLTCPTRAVCCYPREQGFVETVAALVRPALAAAAAPRPPRLLLTAHGLPQRVVAAGDPYPHQVALSAAAVVAALALPGLAHFELDWRLCFQSRVGPLAWLQPSTDDEIRRAGRDEAPLVVAPISFVSEHSETLVELDRDYRRLAERSGVPSYHRVATVGTAPAFIDALAGLVRRAAGHEGIGPGEPARICGPMHAKCALAGTRWSPHAIYDRVGPG